MQTVSWLIVQNEWFNMMSVYALDLRSVFNVACPQISCCMKETGMFDKRILASCSTDYYDRFSQPTIQRLAASLQLA